MDRAKYLFVVYKSKSITIPNSVVCIEDDAFIVCYGFSIRIPKSIIYIGSGAFSKATIECEIENKPSTWADDWCYESTVNWGC